MELMIIFVVPLALGLNFIINTAFFVYLLVKKLCIDNGSSKTKVGKLQKVMVDEDEYVS
jgi:hypothetical protein